MAEVTSDSWCYLLFSAHIKRRTLLQSCETFFLSAELFLSFSVSVLRAHGGLEEQGLRNHVRVCVTFWGVPGDQVFRERLTRLLVDPHHLLHLPLLPGGESRDSTALVWMITLTNAMSTSVNSEYATGASLLLSYLSMLISIVYMMFMPGSHTMHISIVTNLLFFSRFN